MPEIRKIEDATHEGKDGFVIEWEMVGLFTEGGARFRAVGTTALRFPTTITEAEVVGVRELGKRKFNVRVFVPTEGFPAAGIQNPVKWFREQFGEERVFING